MKTTRIGRAFWLACLILLIGQVSIWAYMEEYEELPLELFILEDVPYGLIETQSVISDIPPRKRNRSGNKTT